LVLNATFYQNGIVRVWIDERENWSNIGKRFSISEEGMGVVEE